MDTLSLDLGTLAPTGQEGIPLHRRREETGTPLHPQRLGTQHQHTHQDLSTLLLPDRPTRPHSPAPTHRPQGRRTRHLRDRRTHLLQGRPTHRPQARRTRHPQGESRLTLPGSQCPCHQVRSAEHDFLPCGRRFFLCNRSVRAIVCEFAYLFSILRLFIRAACSVLCKFFANTAFWLAFSVVTEARVPTDRCACVICALLYFRESAVGMGAIPGPVPLE